MRRAITMTSSTNRFGALILAAALATGLLVALLAGTPQEAEAAFPGTNGKIAFANYRADDEGEIYVMNPNGTGKTRLTNNPAAGDRDPALSPDGKKIAFTSSRDGNFEIYTMDAVDGDGDGNGDNQVRLTNNSANDFDPAFSPNGQKIAFASFRDGNHEIFAMNANGTGQTNLTNNTAHDLDPAYAPDGTKIAFASSRDGDSEVYEMNADGSGMPVSLTSDPAEVGAPDWQPVCTISGTTGDDFITANQSPGNDVICGLGGSDQIDAGGGNDVVVGGEGNDTIKGGSGRDRVFGGFGEDTLNVKDGIRRNDVVDGGEGIDACKRDRGDRKVSCEQ